MSNSSEEPIEIDLARHRLAYAWFAAAHVPALMACLWAPAQIAAGGFLAVMASLAMNWRRLATSSWLELRLTGRDRWSLVSVDGSRQAVTLRNWRRFGAAWVHLEFSAAEGVVRLSLFRRDLGSLWGPLCRALRRVPRQSSLAPPESTGVLTASYTDRQPATVPSGHRRGMGSVV